MGDGQTSCRLYSLQECSSQSCEDTVPTPEDLLDVIRPQDFHVAERSNHALFTSHLA